jgi:hypothetical protein
MKSMHGEKHRLSLRKVIVAIAFVVLVVAVDVAVVEVRLVVFAAATSFALKRAPK